MAAETRQRLDKWLWFARIVKSRPSAARLVSGGHVRQNRLKVVKPGHDIAIGDTLTVAIGGRVKVMKVIGLAARRGPASTARLLYEELGPPDGHTQKMDASSGGTC